MLHSLPLEILDYIGGHLFDNPTALKACCLVSKSWVPQTRKHLFFRVEFYAPASHFEMWKKTFLNPSDSPAHYYARSLSVQRFPVVTTADADMGGWICAPHNLVHLELECFSREDRLVSLVPFHGLSPTLRSLSLTCTHPGFVDLTCPFPPPEDLVLVALSDRTDAGGWDPPSTSPELTGSL